MQPKQPATRAEARALAHPVRLRIIRLASQEALSTSQLSARLEVEKATVLHHVRTLLREGFLTEAPPRRSAAGRPEKPYRSTRKSLTISLTGTPQWPLAVLDAFRQEVAEHDDPFPAIVRRPLRLSVAARAELVERLSRLADEFEARDDPGGDPINFAAFAVRSTGAHLE